MTPQEKAKELVHKMWIYALPNAKGSWVNAKKLSLIAVDEIYNEIDDNYDTLHSSDRKQYWQDVKSEIEKL
jgi:hypothetical protein